MTFRFLKLALVAAVLLLPAAKAVCAADKVSDWIESELARAKQKYRSGEFNRKQYWYALYIIREKSFKKGRDGHPELFQAQAYLLEERGFAIAAARFAVQAIAAHQNPLDSSLEPSWNLLQRVSQKHSILDLFAILVERVDASKGLPPSFGNDWHHFIAEKAADDKDFKKAALHYAKLKPSDRLYLPSQYHLAMIYSQEDKNNKAINILNQLLHPSVKAKSTLPEFRKTEILAYAKLAVGRLQYGETRYVKAVRSYRLISKASYLFYDAMFEQAWALFMGGFPNHALGILHSVDGPYFEKRFNPEVSILRSLIYYWMCRYEDSRNAMADFIEIYHDSVLTLDDWLRRKNLDDAKSYELFENVLHGLSESALGISPELLSSVAQSDRMRLKRDQLASLMQERNKFESAVGFGAKRAKRYALLTIDTWIKKVQLDLGRVFREDLEDLRDDYADLRYQAKFLYVELLMSEKEQLLGRELHKDSKMIDADADKRIKGWGRSSQSWRSSSLDEFWWDEVGYHVYAHPSLCREDQTPQ